MRERSEYSDRTMSPLSSAGVLTAKLKRHDLSPTTAQEGRNTSTPNYDLFTIQVPQALNITLGK